MKKAIFTFIVSIFAVGLTNASAKTIECSGLDCLNTTVFRFEAQDWTQGMPKGAVVAVLQNQGHTVSVDKNARFSDSTLTIDAHFILPDNDGPTHAKIRFSQNLSQANVTFFDEEDTTSFDFGNYSCSESP